MSMAKKYVYADHAATTRLSSEALDSMLPYLNDVFGNPSTQYSDARKPRLAIAHARQMIAEAIGAHPEEIFFTSGGTESDNWAIKGTAFRYPGQEKRIVTSCIEHPAVLRSCGFLQSMGFEIVYLPVDRYGLVSLKALGNALNDQTILVSIMAANNEIGTIEPLSEIAALARSRDIPFHTDAVQAVGHIPVNVNDMGVDMLSASAHKFNGPKGVGFLYMRNGVKIEPLLSGGGQEKHLRAGTENVAGIVGMAAALSRNVNEMAKNELYLENLRQVFLAKLQECGLNYIINGAEHHIPGSISVSFNDFEGEMLLHRLDLMGIKVATGSACDSVDTRLSHVIRAIGVPESYAQGTIRVTFGPENTNEDARFLAESIHAIERRDPWT